MTNNLDKRVELYKLIVARSDITEALYITRIFLKEIKDLKDEKYFALQNAIIVSYTRPFTSNKPFGPLEKEWSKFSDPKHAAIHLKIIRHRHQSAAHSDFDIRKVCIEPKGVIIKPMKTKSEEIGVTVRNEAFPISSFKVIEHLCLGLGSRIHQEVEKRIDEIFGNVNLPVKEFELIDEHDVDNYKLKTYAK